MLDPGYFNDVRGAVYFPSRAYNAYQLYSRFSPEETDRDMSYARLAGLNALRVFTSYEFWCQDPEGFFARFETLLTCAAAHGIRLMPVLFEDCGKPNTPENRLGRDPIATVCVRSPDAEIERDPARWGEPAAYLRAFFERYRDDKRLLAVEIMNEPHRQRGNLPFARRLALEASAVSGSVPLTMGCMRLEDDLCFADLIQIYQFHNNFPRSETELRNDILRALAVQEVTGKPVWLTEWQRIRSGGPGWGVEEIPRNDTLPDLASAASIVRESGIGNFFWSLMVKPAYLQSQRPNGTFNGMFHEDGSVYSARDFLAVAGDVPAPPERRSMPEWYLEDLRASYPEIYARVTRDDQPSPSRLTEEKER